MFLLLSTLLIYTCHSLNTIRVVLSSIDYKELINDINTNTLVYGFNMYTDSLTKMKMSINYLYNNYEFAHLSIDVITYGVNYLYSIYYNYNIEPIENQWINHTFIYPENMYNYDYKMIEEYDTIAYNKNQSMIDCIINKKLSEIRDTSYNLDSYKEMYILKYKDMYIYRLSGAAMLQIKDLNFKHVSNPFFSIEYENKDTKQRYELDLPNSMFIVGNEILSTVFIKRWFEYNQPDDMDSFYYSNNYCIHLTDEDFNDITLTSKQYIILTNNSYAIKTY